MSQRVVVRVLVAALALLLVGSAHGAGTRGVVAQSKQFVGATARPYVGGPSALPPGVAVIAHPPGESFRWTDQDWIARVQLTVVNQSNMVASFSRSVFDAVATGGPPMTDWGAASNLPETITLAPGQQASGTVAWYYNRALPRPGAVTVTAAGSPLMVTVPLTPVPDMGAGGAPVAVAVPVNNGWPPGVQVRAMSAQSYRWSDRDWIAAVQVLVINGSGMPVQINPALFEANANGIGMTRWPAAATLQNPFMLAPGQSTTGTVAWYYNASMPRPMAVTVTVPGAFQQTLMTTPGRDLAR